MKIANSLATLIVLLPLQVLALPTDNQKPIQVEADSLEVRDEENISIYNGNVRLIQGSLEIQSENLVIHFNAAKELTLMQMTGTPATFRQLDTERKELKGQADKLDYTASDSVLLLQGNALFTHDGDTIKSQKIRVNTQNNSIEAGSTEANSRIHMTIQPKQP